MGTGDEKLKTEEEERQDKRETKTIKGGCLLRQRERERERERDRKRAMEEGGREIKIAERRESRQRLFPQDVVTTTTTRQRGIITTHWSL